MQVDTNKKTTAKGKLMSSVLSETETETRREVCEVIECERLKIAIMMIWCNGPHECALTSAQKYTSCLLDCLQIGTRFLFIALDMLFLRTD